MDSGCKFLLLQFNEKCCFNMIMVELASILYQDNLRVDFSHFLGNIQILFLSCQVARQLSVRIETENLHLPTPLPYLGEFEVPLRLPKSIPLPEGKVQWTLDVKIRRK